jgi:hypothetical protein
MSSIASIPAAQPEVVTSSGKYTAQQTADTQPQPAATASSSATISQAAHDAAAQDNKITPYSDDPRAAASYLQMMAEKFAGSNQIRATYASDPSNPLYAQQLAQAAQQNFSTGTGEGAAYDLSWGKTSANLLKMNDNLHYVGGEPVTTASQAYQQQQVNSYKNAATQLYNSEKAKGTAPGDIIIKRMDLQGQQPARFRAMMGWPNAADFANNAPSATSGGVKSA